MSGNAKGVHPKRLITRPYAFNSTMFQIYLFGMDIASAKHFFLSPILYDRPLCILGLTIFRNNAGFNKLLPRRLNLV